MTPFVYLFRRPLEIIESLIEDGFILLFDEKIKTTIGFSCGIILNTILLLVAFQLISFNLGYFLLLFSILNCLYFFLHKKTYQFIHNTPHKEFQINSFNPPSPRCHLSTLQQDDGKSSKIFILNIWDPTIISTHIFLIFSPVHVLLALTFKYDNIIQTLIDMLLLILIDLFINVLWYKTQDKEKDQICVFGQSYDVYNQFVLKKLGIRKKHVSTMTNLNDICPSYRQYPFSLKKSGPLKREKNPFQSP